MHLGLKVLPLFGYRSWAALVSVLCTTAFARSWREKCIDEETLNCELLFVDFLSKAGAPSEHGLHEFVLFAHSTLVDVLAL
jgi:hypothetical protein